MKKMVKVALLTSMVMSLFFTSCSSGGGSDSTTPQKAEDLLKGTDSVVDLSGADLGSEKEFKVTSGKTIKNFDFEGKTLIISSDDVILDNISNVVIVITDNVNDEFSLTGCKDIQKITIEGGSIVLVKDSKINDFEVKKDNVSVKLEDDTSVSKIKINANNTEVNSSSTTTETPKITNIEVSSNVVNVNVAGGSIEKITVNTDSTSTPTVTVTGKTEITSVKEKNAEGIETTGSIAVTEEAKKQGFEAPTGVTENVIQVISTNFINNSKKLYYQVGEELDVSGFYVKVTYDNGGTKTISLVTENFTGFDSSKAGNCKVTVTYNNTTLATLEYLIVDENMTDTQKVELSNKYISSGIQKLINANDLPNFDSVIADFKKAYETNKSDKTRLYYALTELATISVDPSVSKLLKDNFGLLDYPSTLNALMSDSWFKEYRHADVESFVPLKWIKSTDPKKEGWLVRGDGEKVTSGNNTVILAYEEKVNEKTGKKQIVSNWIDKVYNFKPSTSGKYFVSIGDLPDGQTNPEKYYDYFGYVVNDYANITMDYSDYYWSAPKFDSSELKEQGWYQASLFEGAETSSTLIMLMIGNLMNCNPNGFNGLIDNILKVFDSKFANAQKLINEMSDNSVELPEELLVGLNEESLIGMKSVRIGKQEAQLFLVPFTLFKGAFQWLSSYDLSFNLGTKVDDLPKYVMMSNTESEIVAKLMTMNTNTSLGVRNASAMETSKKTFANAIQTVCDTYNYLISEKSSNPEWIKDMLKSEGSEIYNIVVDAKTALEKGQVMTVYDFKIDLEKLFTPGYFTNIFEKDATGQVQWYYVIECEERKEVKSDGWITTSNYQYFTDSEKITDPNNMWESSSKLYDRLEENIYTDDHIKHYYINYESPQFKINIKLLKQLFPGMFTQYTSDYIFIAELIDTYSKDVPYNQYTNIDWEWDYTENYEY